MFSIHVSLNPDAVAELFCPDGKRALASSKFPRSVEERAFRPAFSVL
jgi:hypothetical protein